MDDHARKIGDIELHVETMSLEVGISLLSQTNIQILMIEHKTCSCSRCCFMGHVWLCLQIGNPKTHCELVLNPVEGKIKHQEFSHQKVISRGGSGYGFFMIFLCHKNATKAWCKNLLALQKKVLFYEVGREKKKKQRQT